MKTNSPCSAVFNEDDLIPDANENVIPENASTVVDNVTQHLLSATVFSPMDLLYAQENSHSCSTNKAQVSVNPVKDDLPRNVVCAENLPIEQLAFGTDVEYSSCSKENGGQCAISKATSYVVQSDEFDKIRDKGGTVVPRDSGKSYNRCGIHFNTLLT